MQMRVFAIAAVLAVIVLGGGWLLMNRAGGGGGIATGAAPSADEDASETAAAAVPPAAADPLAARRAPRPARPGEDRAAPPPPVAPARGVLHVDSDVPGAQVFLDRTFAGYAPVTIQDVAPGSHRINVSAEGFDGVAEDIEVQPGPQNVTLALRVVRLDTAVPVVHKHRLGSCTGRLIGTPDGIRYETAHAEDAFTVRLDALDVFQVDYLEKNLRVQPRGGRQYNFTHPEGNADSLFVFHRDVEKARGRVAQ